MDAPNSLQQAIGNHYRQGIYTRLGNIAAHRRFISGLSMHDLLLMTNPSQYAYLTRHISEEDNQNSAIPVTVSKD
jgi:hypothetical protein